MSTRSKKYMQHRYFADKQNDLILKGLEKKSVTADNARARAAWDREVGRIEVRPKTEVEKRALEFARMVMKNEREQAKRMGKK